MRRDAEQKQISLNTLANQIFDFYVKFANSAKLGTIPVSKAAVVELVERCSDDEIRSIAQRICKKAATEIALQLRGRYDFGAVLDIWKYHLKATGVPFRHKIDEHNKNRHTFIIQYGMGRKWSLFAAEAMKTWFEPVSAKKPEYTITDNMVAITVEGYTLYDDEVPSARDNHKKYL